MGLVHKKMAIVAALGIATFRASIALAATASAEAIFTTNTVETSAGWKKFEGNPIMGGKYGTCFDISVLKERDVYRMWLSWRPKKSVALVESPDGVHWSEPPRIVLPPKEENGWEDDINRPVVLKRGTDYHMWYTGQAKGHSWIGYATSVDGINWSRQSDKPVLSPELPWEKGALMCPHVLWDEKKKEYKMWYSGGGQNEPDAIGYATSPDGLHWKKHPQNPIFQPDKQFEWERDRVTGCQVIKEDGWYVMFYIGFRDINHAQIGIARSPDGITNWQRHPQNPIVHQGKDRWDHDACYKPYAIFDGKKWLLWYNGRHAGLEQIGVVFHEGKDLGFPWLSKAPAKTNNAAAVLKPDSFKHFIDTFNSHDRELYAQSISNCIAWDFLKENIPLLDCPDKTLEEIYYFRWWTYRKHIKQTPDGYIITEFLPPVPWAGKYNSICCAAGHHLYEGRWLRDPGYLDDYSRFWFHGGGNPRTYSFWAADSVWSRYLVTGDSRLPKELLPDLIKNFEAWEKTHRDPNGLFWQADGNDGMEVSISGALQPNSQGYRATINSYMYGDALAIARIAELSGKQLLSDSFKAKAAEIKRLVQEKLWDSEAQFFKVLPRTTNATLSDVRELHGYTPWYFCLPDKDKSIAWKELMSSKSFYAPFGPTTAEQSHKQFAISYQGHECQWNGPSWPYSTALTLTALGNLLNQDEQSLITKKDYLTLLKIYAKSHHLKLDDGQVVPWIDENLNPITGDWIARTRLKTWANGTWDRGKGGEERGKDYNHSTFCDLLISGLIGLRPRPDSLIEVNPLLPQNEWSYFCLDQIPYHGRLLTILYDSDGKHYKRGKGMRVLVNGKTIAATEKLQRIFTPAL